MTPSELQASSTFVGDDVQHIAAVDQMVGNYGFAIGEPMGGSTGGVVGPYPAPAGFQWVQVQCFAAPCDPILKPINGSGSVPIYGPMPDPTRVPTNPAGQPLPPVGTEPGSPVVATCEICETLRPYLPLIALAVVAFVVFR